MMDEAYTRREHEQYALRVQEENKRQNKRIDSLEESLKEIKNLTTNVERLAVNMESMVKEQERQGKRLDTLESRDGEKWRRTMGYIATAVIGVIAGCICMQIGLGAF